MNSLLKFILLTKSKVESFVKEPNSHYVSVGLNSLTYQVKKVMYIDVENSHNISIGLTDYSIVVTQTGENIL